MSAKHTPGPWTLNGSSIEACDGAGMTATLAHIYDEYANALDPAEIAANARLIALSPTLLASLKAVVPSECPIVTHHKPDCRWCAALKVIAKADGAA